MRGFRCSCLPSLGSGVSGKGREKEKRYIQEGSFLVGKSNFCDCLYNYKEAKLIAHNQSWNQISGVLVHADVGPFLRTGEENWW